MVVLWSGPSDDDDVDDHDDDVDLLFFQVIHLLCGSFFLGVRSDSSKMLRWLGNNLVVPKQFLLICE